MPICRVFIVPLRFLLVNTRLMFLLTRSGKAASPIYITDEGTFFQHENIAQLGLLSSIVPAANSASERVDVNTLLHGGSMKVNAADMSLRLTIPQAYIRQTLRGYVDPVFWDEGIPALMLDTMPTITTTKPKAADAIRKTPISS
ncbi:fimbrial usher protein [Citrobacter koseri]|uniref:Fimbrial usher protein n=1 Tax=Citrobacter koseri TaxID=545 RepID=A0A2X2VDW0_CITKO|nr:fimbrial usher protein [Citrobacter koseri]